LIELLQQATGLPAYVVVMLPIAAACTSFVSAVVGVGGGTILLGLMSVWLSPAVLIPVHGVVQLGSNTFRSALLISHVRWSVVLPFLVGTLVGSVTSGLILAQLPVWIMQVGISLFLVWAVFGSASAMGKLGSLAAGGISGFLTMLFGATGPFVNAFVKTLGLPPTSLIATSACLMTVQHLLKLLVFGALGFAFRDYVPLMISMLICGFVGTYLGRQILFKINPLTFTRILNGVLLIIAARLMMKALQQI